MSSTILITIQNQVTLYGYSLFMILGTIGNTFVAIIFSQQRQNTCSIYLLLSAIMNVFYLISSGFIKFFPVNYGDATPREFVLCKIYTYIPSVIGQITKTMIMLASIDRFLITSDRATYRAFSTRKLAMYLIVLSFILWPLLAIHIPIMVTIVNGQCGKFGIYSTIFTIYAIIFVRLIPPVITGIFGYLTYRNVRQIHNRIQPIEYSKNDANITIHQRDRDLIILVISEILVYIITSCPFPLIYLEMMISQYTVSKKSIQYSQIEIFVTNIATFLLFVNFAAPFYTYLIVSRSFRRESKQLILNIYRKLRGQPPTQIVTKTEHTLRQRETHI